MLNGAPLTWKSGHQSIVTTSSTEAEYVAACECTKEIVWLRKMLSTMMIEASEPTVMYEDNNSCIAQIENPLNHKCTNQIEIYYHHTKQMVKENVVKLWSINTEEQLADILTKPLTKTVFQKHLISLGYKDAKVLTLTN